VNASFQNLGFRKNNVSLILSKENYNHIKDIAKDLNTPLFTCSPDANQDSVIIHKVNVLWHGIGERSLVEIVVPTYDGKSAEVRVELESKGINIFETKNSSDQAHETIKSCSSLKTDSLFDTYSAIPNQVGIERIDEFKNKIGQYLEKGKLKVDVVTITGYADQAPVLKKGDSNFALSKRRAEAVAERLVSLYGELRTKHKEAIHIFGNGSIMPKSNCSDHLSARELEECRAIDRRVEIEFVFSRQE
jgi:outer membrane protein OmpA-like peptidoglycan-associated protein